MHNKELSSYFCKKNVGMAQFHELRVKTIKRETAEAVSVGFDVAPDLKDEFAFEAGQYLTLEKKIAGKKFRRSYSICTSPESGDLKVAVKQTVDGRFSTWVNNKLKVGHTLNVFLPEGRFTFKSSPAEAKTYVAFAAGSGITPVMGILKSVLQSSKTSKFILVYGNKTPKHTIFYKDLLELQQNYPERLFVEFIYSRSKENQSFFGRIERSTVNYIIKNKFKNHNFGSFYLCGPASMIDLVSGVLKEHKIADDRIHHELFVTKNSNAPQRKDTSNKTTVTVILDEEETTFEMDRGTRVLQAIKAEDLDPPYSCQGGICSSCMALVTEGEVEMVNNQILTDGEIEDGLVLTCQSHPTTDKLTVDYDDV